VKVQVRPCWYVRPYLGWGGLEAVVRFARFARLDGDSGLPGNFFHVIHAGRNPFPGFYLRPAAGLVAPGRRRPYHEPMNAAAVIIGAIIGYGAWVVILGAPVALAIPCSRRWLLRPLRRRIDTRRRRLAGQRERAWAAAQARRDAREAVILAELEKIVLELRNL